MPSILSSSITLPSGLQFPNRLMKAAMAEGLGGSDHRPNDKHVVVYNEWASGGWGGLITGNVQVSPLHLGGGNIDVSLDSDSDATRQAWSRWASAAQAHSTPAIMQISHPGRQSPAGAGERGYLAKALAPSPIPLNIGDSLIARILRRLLFGTPKEMTIEDIRDVIKQFTATAKMAHETGFQGVELHGAHGYLLSQFLSPKSNVRNDAYGGSPAKRAKIVVEIIRAIREVVPLGFTIGIKLNSVDVGSASSLNETLEQIDAIVRERVDFLEISGGSYEDPRMVTGDVHEEEKASARPSAREAFFLTFAKVVRERHPKTTLMVTGGFRTRNGMVAALESGACDLVGIGRPATVFPHLPRDLLLNDGVRDEDANVQLADVKTPALAKILGVKIIAAGAETMHYGAQIQHMAKGKPLAPPLAS